MTYLAPSVEDQDAAVAQFMKALEGLMRAGLGMAAAESPRLYAEAMEQMRLAKVQPQLVVDFNRPSKIALQFVGDDGVEYAEVFSFEVAAFDLPLQ